MYRVGLGLGFVWGLRLQINLIYEFIYIYTYIWTLNTIYIVVNPKRYTGIRNILYCWPNRYNFQYGIDSLGYIIIKTRMCRNDMKEHYVMMN